MIFGIVRLSSIFIVLFAALYRFYLRDIIFVTLGVGRVIRPIEHFPYTCRRIQHERLEACEDMWIDEEARVLYATCTGSLARTNWNPCMRALNVSGRLAGGDYVSVLNIDEPGSDGLFGLHQLKPVNYEGASEDGTMDLLGFDVEVVDDLKLRFWMVNHRPPVDENRQYVDATKVGANSTIEVFEVRRGSSDMVHVKTIASEEIISPNNIAATGDGGFVITNDRSSKVGWLRELDQILGGGSLSYCGPDNKCHIAARSGFNFPNGLVRGKDGLYYVPSAFLDNIRVMELHPNLTMTEVDTIHVGMPIDNLSVDKTGDIYAAAFPKVLELLKAYKDPYNLHARSTVFRIRKSPNGSGYEVRKILEDRDTKAMGSVTVARHDTKTGRLFMGSTISPYITVCEPTGRE